MKRGVTMRKPIDMNKLTQEEIDAEIQKAIDGVKAGKTRLSKDVFAEIRKEYGI